MRGGAGLIWRETGDFVLFKAEIGGDGHGGEIGKLGPITSEFVGIHRATEWRWASYEAGRGTEEHGIRAVSPNWDGCGPLGVAGVLGERRRCAARGGISAANRMVRALHWSDYDPKKGWSYRRGTGWGAGFDLHGGEKRGRGTETWRARIWIFAQAGGVRGRKKKATRACTPVQRELEDVDITAGPPRWKGGTRHVALMMGGNSRGRGRGRRRKVRLAGETCSMAGEAAAGLHGQRIGWGGNSTFRICWFFGRLSRLLLRAQHARKRGSCAPKFR